MLKKRFGLFILAGILCLNGLLYIDGAVAQVPEDGYEDNDTFATAWLVSMGTYSGLGCNDFDYFKIYVDNGMQLSIQLNFTHANGDLDMMLYNQTGNSTDVSGSTTNSELIQYTNLLGSQYFIWQVFGFLGAMNTYTMSVSIDVGITDDFYEENDSPMDAPELDEGTYNNLVAADLDFFLITVPSGNSLTITVEFDNDLGNIDIWLLDAGYYEIDGSVSDNDVETVEFDNEDTSDVDMYLNVENIESGSNEYSITIEFGGIEYDDDADSDNPLDALPGFPLVGLLLWGIFGIIAVLARKRR